MQLFQKRKIFSDFFSIFEIKIQFWTFSKKKVALMADVFFNLRTSKDLDR